jgi:hypothetical protein
MHMAWKVGKPSSMTSKHFATPWKAWTKKPKQTNIEVQPLPHDCTKSTHQAHFKVWMNGLLFLAIYGEGPTGRIVARYLSPPNTTAAIAPGLNEMQVFASPIHNNWLIDLKKFASFVSKQYKIQIALRTGLHVFPRRLLIQHFANLVHDMWNNDAPGSNSTTLWTMQHSHRIPIELSQMSRMPISVK